MERDFLWFYFPVVPWKLLRGFQGVMLMDWGGGVLPFLVVVCFDFFLSCPRYLFLLCPDGFFEKMLEPSSLF